MTYNELSNRVYELLQKPFYAQKSTEWYEMRNKAITASAVGDAIGINKWKSPSDFLFSKYKSDFTHNINCYRGNMYEEICRMNYEIENDVIVNEFSLLTHPDYSYIAASPDGIIGPLKKDGTQCLTVGRMIEIKCPNKITKTGKLIGDICKDYYYAQIQVQLACCNLYECDFVQHQMYTYNTKDEYIEDYDEKTNRSKTSGLRMGILLQLVRKEKYTTDRNEAYHQMTWNTENARWIYPPSLNMTLNDYLAWADDLSTNPDKLNEYIKQNVKEPETYKDFVFDDLKYWRFDDIHTVLFKRDDKWFNEKQPLIKQMWDNVLWLKKNKAYADKLYEYNSLIKQLNTKTPSKTNSINNEKVMKMLTNLQTSDTAINELNNEIQKLTKLLS